MFPLGKAVIKRDGLYAEDELRSQQSAANKDRQKQAHSEMITCPDVVLSL